MSVLSKHSMNGCSDLTYIRLRKFSICVATQRKGPYTWKSKLSFVQHVLDDVPPVTLVQILCI